MSSVGLIINCKSDRSASVIDDLINIGKRFADLRTVVLDGVRGIGDAMQGMNAKKVDTLILAGGDGTMQAAFTDAVNNRRFDHTPHYVALPCGMTNVIANDCGLKGAPARALDNFLWRREKGEVRPVQRPLLSISAGGAPPTYGFFMGAGAFCTAVKYSRSRIQARGAKRSVALVASVAGYIAKVASDPEGAIEPVDLNVSSPDADVHEARALRTLYIATTLTRLGAGIYPFWGEGQGAMATTMIDYPTKRTLSAATALLRANSRPWFESEGYRSWRSNEVRLSFDGPYVFDGEFYEADSRSPVFLETSQKVDFLH